MVEGLLIVLGPMFLGYLIKTKNAKFLHLTNNSITGLMYIILFVMGISLGQLDDLAQTLPLIAGSALTFSVVIHLCNIAGLMIYDRLSPQPIRHPGKNMPARWKLLLESARLCSMVVLGFIIGLLTKEFIALPFGASTYVLIALIFFVGVQLRNNGISLREVFFNKRGIYTALIVITTSLTGGIIAGAMLSLPLNQALAIASGFGWYSLSSVVLNDAWGAVFGSIAFFNDLSREVLSLFIVPFFMLNSRSTAIGITGATALDCTLPVIQRSGGIEVVPLAISYGFLINLVSPVLLVFFASIPL